MACRVGMTTDPEGRRAYWQRQHPTLRNWQILQVVNTKSEAQRLESSYAHQYGCVSSPGGDGPENARVVCL